MTIKYAARGISTQMRTAEELLFTDGVTLKPVDGRDVFVEDNNNERIIVGTGYNASTGGCTVNGVVYESGSDLNDNALYVVPFTLSAYNLSTETLVWIGYNGTMYLTPTFYWIEYSDLIAEDLYLTDTVPTQTPVWKISDGTAGTRYTGSLGDAVVKDAGGTFNYYATNMECDEVWTTEEPSEEDEYTEEIWCLRNNDERNYDIRRDNAAPSIYKDGSLKTEFGKTYEVLELRSVNGDLVDVKQEGIEKPVNAVCPTVSSGDVANNQVTMYYQWYGNSTYISAYTVKVRVLDYLTLYTAQYADNVRNYGDVTVTNGTTLGVRQRGENDSGRIPEMYKKGYIYNIIKVLKDDGTEIDKAGISVINDGGYFAVKNNSGSDISFNRLQVKLEVDPDPTFTAYSRSGSYQKSNNTLSETTWTTLYEPGSNSAVTGDITKDYEIIGMWNASGVSVYKDGIGLSCYLYSGNPRIRIFNKYGNGTITWNYIEYKAYDKFRLYMLPSHDDMELGISSGAPDRFNRNGVPNAKRTPNEIYTITGAYKADGTPVEYRGLAVEYSDSGYGSFGIYNRDSSYGSVTLSYVEFTVSVQQSD